MDGVWTDIYGVGWMRSVWIYILNERTIEHLGLRLVHLVA